MNSTLTCHCCNLKIKLEELSINLFDTEIYAFDDRIFTSIRGHLIYFFVIYIEEAWSIKYTFFLLYLEISSIPMSFLFKYDIFVDIYDALVSIKTLVSFGVNFIPNYIHIFASILPLCSFSSSIFTRTIEPKTLKCSTFGFTLFQNSHCGAQFNM